MQEEDEFENLPVTKPATTVSFIRAKDHDLQALFRGLEKVSKKAIKKLVEGLESTDEKLSIECAKTLLRFQVDVSKEINTDAMQRTIAEIRFNNTAIQKIKNIASSEDELPPRTVVDFSNIQNLDD